MSIEELIEWLAIINTGKPDKRIGKLILEAELNDNY